MPPGLIVSPSGALAYPPGLAVAAGLCQAQGGAAPFATLAFDSASYNAATGLYTLPAWLAIACPTAARSSQDSASTVRRGYAANAARGRDVGSGVGLSVERADTNAQTAPPTVGGTGWGLFQTTALLNQITAPDGALTGSLVSMDASVTQGQVFPQSAGAIIAGNPYATSVWIRTVAGNSATGQVYLGNAIGGSSTVNVTAAWKRFTFAELAPSSTTPYAPSIYWSANAGQLRQFYFWGSQYVTGKVAGSFMSNASRACDVLTCPVPSAVAPGGLFNASLVLAPNYASTEQTADHDLLYFDANNRLFLQQSTRKVVLRIAGADVLSSALTWSREQALTITAKHGSAGRQLVIAGATTGNGDSGVQSSAAAITLPAAVGVLGNGTTTQESADLRSLVFGVPS